MHACVAARFCWNIDDASKHGSKKKRTTKLYRRRQMHTSNPLYYFQSGGRRRRRRRIKQTSKQSTDGVWVDDRSNRLIANSRTKVESSCSILFFLVPKQTIHAHCLLVTDKRQDDFILGVFFHVLRFYVCCCFWWRCRDVLPIKEIRVRKNNAMANERACRHDLRMEEPH